MQTRTSVQKARPASRPRSRTPSPFFAPVGHRSRSASLPFFQPKLRVGAPGDRFEREADRVAERIAAGGRAPAGTIQREENDKDKDKDPLTEGAKLTAGKVLEKPEVKKAIKGVWDGLPPNAQAGLMTVGGVSLGAAYVSLVLSPKMRETFEGVDIGKPLSLIPYLPIEGFKYKLPVPGKTGFGLSAEFGFEDYFSLIRRHWPRFPINNLTFGLEGRAGLGGGFGITGGKAALSLFGGALKAEGKSITELSAYPQLVPGAGPLASPSRLMQSYPGLPPIQTGPGGQFMLSVDFAKIFPGVLGGGGSR